VTVRLRPDELAQLDDLVVRLALKVRSGPGTGRSWRWNRGRAVRLALVELDRLLAEGASLKSAVERPTVATSTARRPTKSDRGSSDDPDVAELPAHGPGCKPMAGASSRAEGERRYICAAGCPRPRALAREAGS